MVLSSRSKLEMEELFKRTIPQESRFGTRFVFREVGFSICMHACNELCAYLSAGAKPWHMTRAGQSAHP